MLYEETLTALQRGKFVQYMDKLVRYDGEVMSTMTYLCKLYDKGYTEPSVEENVVEYNRRTGEEKKPQTKRYFYNTETDRYIECTKTDFEFLSFIKDKGYTGEGYLQKVTQREEERKQAEKQKQEQERREREERAKQAEEERQQRRKQYAEVIKQETERGKSILFQNTPLQVQLAVLLKTLEPYLEEHHDKSFYREEPFEDHVNDYKNEVKNIIYKCYGNPTRYVELVKEAYDEERFMQPLQRLILRTFFDKLTNIQEGDAKQTIHAKIKACLECRTYKGSVTKEVETVSFWITKNKQFYEVQGEFKKVKNRTVGIYHNEEDRRWDAIDLLTGTIVGKNTAKQKLLADLKELPERYFNTEGYAGIIGKTLRSLSISPYIRTVSHESNSEDINIKGPNGLETFKGKIEQSEKRTLQIIYYEDILIVYSSYGDYLCTSPNKEGVLNTLLK